MICKYPSVIFDAICNSGDRYNNNYGDSLAYGFRNVNITIHVALYAVKGSVASSMHCNKAYFLI